MQPPADQSIPPTEDIVTPEWLARHGVRIDRKTGEVVNQPSVHVVLNARRRVFYAESRASCPLDWYRAHGNIDDKQHRAGSEFHRLWYYSTLHSRYAQCRYSEFRSGLADPMFLAAMDQRYVRAGKAIRTETRWRAVHRACCEQSWVGGARTGDRNDRFQALAMKRLRAGLDDLARHFGY